MNTEDTNSKDREFQTIIPKELRIITPDQVDDSWEYKVTSASANMSDEDLERLINELGSDGWELKVSWVVRTTKDVVRLIFGR